MARPRTPSNVLEFRGSFKKNPKRRRIDAKGTGEFNRDPPQHLPQEFVRAWSYVVARLPEIALTATDELAVEVTARLLARWWVSGELDVVKELRAWLAKLGMTPQDRTRIPGSPPAGRNRFADLR